MRDLKFCRYCGELIPPGGRSDREFCREKYGRKDFCKNACNNKKTLANYHETKTISRTHIKNRDVLKRLLGNLEAKTVTEAELTAQGFVMNAIVKRAVSETGNSVFLYLNYGLEVVGTNRYKIFRHGEKL